MEDQTVIATETAVLTAPISAGDPEADFLWFKDDREIDADDRHVMAYADGKATLTIKNSVLKDAASYRVEAHNKVGFVETTANLKVYGKGSFGVVLI